VIDLTGNHWGTTVDAQIAARILDHVKDATRPTVRYQPSSSPLLKRPPQGSGDGTPNQQYVTAAYEDLLQRPVDAGGLSYWSNLLDPGGSRSAVAGALTHSAEYDATIIESAYQG